MYRLRKRAPAPVLADPELTVGGYILRDDHDGRLANRPHVIRQGGTDQAGGLGEARPCPAHLHAGHYAPVGNALALPQPFAETLANRARQQSPGIFAQQLAKSLVNEIMAGYICRRDRYLGAGSFELR